MISTFIEEISLQSRVWRSTNFGESMGVPKVLRVRRVNLLFFIRIYYYTEIGKIGLDKGE